MLSNMDSSKYMLARGLGLIAFGFLIGITFTTNAQVEEIILADEGKATEIKAELATKDIPLLKEMEAVALAKPVAKIDAIKTTQELIADKIELNNEINERDYLASKYAQLYDSCRFAITSR